MCDVIVGLESILKRLVSQDVELTISCAPDAGLVQADPQDIERVLLNLVANARQAIPGTGTITLGVVNAPISRTDDERISPGSYVALSVSDTGIGMDQQTRARIFEPFFTTRRDGTGLGLAIVHDIVTRSQGIIRVDSELGCGTTFTVLLPRLDKGNMKERSEHEQES